MSYYALVKAALAMFGSFMRSSTMFCNYIRPSKRKHSKKGFFPWLFRSAVLVACVYTFIGACLVWIFTYSEPPDADDEGGFRPPDSISKSYDTDRYLYKSGIFFRHPNFERCNTSEPFLQNWAQLAEIYDVTDANGLDVTSTFAYSDVQNFFYFNFPDVPGRINPIDGYETCYRTDLMTCDVTELPAITPCKDAIDTLSNVYNFTFYSLPKTKTIVFGDIVFNASVSINGSCEYPEVDPYGNLLINNTIVAQMQYFRIQRDINDTFCGTFLYDLEYRYYEFDPEPESVDLGDLLNVTEEWKTGYQRCDMSGSLRPNPREFDERGDCEAPNWRDFFDNPFWYFS